MGFGRPVWTDDPDFQIENHVSVVSCPEPGGVQSVLDIAAELPTPAETGRPLWRIRIITHTGERQAALVAVFHHVLADGIAGLAVLAGIVDGAERMSPGTFPRTAPTRRALFADALMEHIRTIRRLPQALRRLAAAFHRVAPGGATAAAAIVPQPADGPAPAIRQPALQPATDHRCRPSARRHGERSVARGDHRGIAYPASVPWRNPGPLRAVGTGIRPARNNYREPGGTETG